MILLLLLLLISVVAAPEIPSPRLAGGAISPQKPAVQNLLPSPTGYVNDYAHALNDDTRVQIEQALAEFKKRSKIDFKIALLSSTGGQPITDYSKLVFQQWNIGAGGEGILLLVAIEDHQWRLHISRGLSRDLSEEKIREVGALMNPLFGQEHYGDGIRRGVEAIIKTLAARRGFAPINIPAPLLPTE
jgi:uncharacterized protein